MNIYLRVFTFLFFSNYLISQDSFEQYIENNSICIDNGLVYEELIKLEFFKYNAYFFGENHESGQVVSKEILMLEALKDIKHVFIEFPVKYYSIYNDLMNISRDDISDEKFKLYSGENKNQEILLRNLYYKNTTTCNNFKYKLIPIDMISFDEISINDFLWFFRRKKTKSVKKGFGYIKNIKKDKSKNEDYAIGQYELFRNNFYLNNELYKNYFGDNYIEVKKNIDGIHAYSITKKEDTLYAIKSNSREDFMLSNIMSEVKNDSINKFVSINGAYHIPLNENYDWDFLNKWEPLARKFKDLAPEMKTCSVYFLDKNNDGFGDKYFQFEKDILLRYIKNHKTYLIRLDGENTPFKELSEKFQYIVVW